MELGLRSGLGLELFNAYVSWVVSFACLTALNRTRLILTLTQSLLNLTLSLLTLLTLTLLTLTLNVTARCLFSYCFNRQEIFFLPKTVSQNWPTSVNPNPNPNPNPFPYPYPTLNLAPNPSLTVTHHLPYSSP